MRKNDPRAFAEHIMKAELNRVKERASLRHRGGSKFSRLQKLRAKYDAEVSHYIPNYYDLGAQCGFRYARTISRTDKKK